MDMTAVTDKALSLCQPSENEENKIDKVGQRVKMLVEEYISGVDEVVDVVFGGSFAKGTWLHGDADIDIFIKIKPSVSLERFEQLGKCIGLTALKGHHPALRYSDHPYVEAFVDRVRVNVVPCYDVERGRWQSAADRSPFHTEYIRQNFDEDKKNQARLLKRFLKSAGIYGAEIATAGFSGYVSEVLVLRYGAFEGVLQAASELQERQVIAVDDNYDRDIVKGFQGPLIIIDPVDIRRNLGTAISPESVAKFVLCARSFLRTPSLRFFSTTRKKDGARARQLHNNILIVELAHRERSPDVVWGQLKRSLKAITKQLEIAGFVVLRSSCITDEKKSAALAFLLESLTLPPYMKRKGPAVFRKSDAENFVASAKKKPHVAWVDREMRIAFLVERKSTEAGEFVRIQFRNNKGNSGIPKDIASNSSKLRIYSGRDRKITRLAKEAVAEIVSTEHFIFE